MNDDTPIQMLKIGGESYVIMPVQEYEALMHSAGELSRRLRTPIEVSSAMPVFSDGESRLRTWRKHRGFTLEQLALLVDGHKSNLSDLERGKEGGTRKTWQKLAKALNVSLEDIQPLA